MAKETKVGQGGAREKVLAELKEKRLMAISGEDTGKLLVVHYTFSDGKDTNDLRVELAYDNPHMHSIADVYPSAKFYEQEIWEMFGVEFLGNPTERLLTHGDKHHLRKE